MKKHKRLSTSTKKNKMDPPAISLSPVPEERKKKGTTCTNSLSNSSEQVSTKDIPVLNTKKKLRLRLIKATKLKATDSNGALDTFVKVKGLKEWQQSKTIKKSLNPIWDECFLIDAENDITVTVHGASNGKDFECIATIALAIDKDLPNPQMLVEAILTFKLEQGQVEMGLTPLTFGDKTSKKLDFVGTNVPPPPEKFLGAPRKQSNSEPKKTGFGKLGSFLGWGKEEEEAPAPASVISGPTDVQHLGHASWNKEKKEFDIMSLPPEFARQLEGINQALKHMGMDGVTEEEAKMVIRGDFDYIRERYAKKSSKGVANTETLEKLKARNQALLEQKKNAQSKFKKLKADLIATKKELEASKAKAEKQKNAHQQKLQELQRQLEEQRGESEEKQEKVNTLKAEVQELKIKLDAIKEVSNNAAEMEQALEVAKQKFQEELDMSRKEMEEQLEKAKEETETLRETLEKEKEANSSSAEEEDDEHAAGDGEKGRSEAQVLELKTEVEQLRELLANRDATIADLQEELAKQAAPRKGKKGKKSKKGKNDKAVAESSSPESKTPRSDGPPAPAPPPPPSAPPAPPLAPPSNKLKLPEKSSAVEANANNETQAEAGDGNSHANLMDAIRGGQTLKKVEAGEKKKQTAVEDDEGTIMNLIARALISRRKNIEMNLEDEIEEDVENEGEEDWLDDDDDDWL